MERQDRVVTELKTRVIGTSDSGLQRKEVRASVLPESCADLLQIGHSLNGFYSVKGQKEMLNVFCDFSKFPGEDGLKTKFIKVYLAVLI